MRQALQPQQEQVQKAIHPLPDILMLDLDNLSTTEQERVEMTMDALMSIALTIVKDPDDAWECLERSVENLRKNYP